MFTCHPFFIFPIVFLVSFTLPIVSLDSFTLPIVSLGSFSLSLVFQVFLLSPPPSIFMFFYSPHCLLGSFTLPIVFLRLFCSPPLSFMKISRGGEFFTSPLLDFEFFKFRQFMGFPGGDVPSAFQGGRPPSPQAATALVFSGCFILWCF